MRKWWSVLLVLSVLGTGTVAWAGAKWEDPVYIDQGWRSAYASMGSARNSGDSTQYLQIINQNFDGAGGVWVMASDAFGNFAYCYSSASSIVDAARAVASDSFVQVWWDEHNTCTSLEVRTSSTNPPKNP